MIGLGLGFDPRYFDRDVLFRYHAGWAGLSHSRNSPAWRWSRDGVLEEVAPGVLRLDWLDPLAPAWLFEGTRTNVLHDSSDLSAASANWSNAADWTIAPVASVIQGRTAHRHTNDVLGAGFRLRNQVRGTFTGTPETLWVIVEQLDAPTCALGLWDHDANVTVYRARFTYATRAWSTIDGTGTTYARHLAVTGPNGGALWLLAITATGTAGNARRAIVYPVGTADNAGLSAIVHHAQHEEAAFPSSPIVTTASAGASRDADVLTITPAVRYGPLAAYLRFREGGTAFTGTSAADVVAISGASRPFFQVDATSVPGRYRAIYGAGGGADSISTAPASVTMDGGVEILASLSSAGAAQVAVAIDGGDAVAGPLGQARGLGAQWGEDSIRIGSPSTFMRLRDLLVLDGADWTMDDVRRLLPW